MSSDSESSHSSSSEDAIEGTTSPVSTESESTLEFRIQLITYMNTKLDIECDIDNLELEDSSDDTGSEMYSVSGYKIIRFPQNPQANSAHRCFIWSENAYFLADLSTDRVFIRLFSTKNQGKLMSAVFRQRSSDDLEADKLVLLYRGIPEKSEADVPRGKFDILAEPYYQRMEYSFDFDSPEIVMTYIPESAEIYSYPNDARPELK